jgi:hypothetical protein
MREVLADHASHPESKSLGTIGLLQRREVVASAVRTVGRESNHLEEAEAGLPSEWNEVQLVYEDPARDEWVDVIVPWLGGGRIKRLLDGNWEYPADT